MKRLISHDIGRTPAVPDIVNEQSAADGPWATAGGTQGAVATSGHTIPIVQEQAFLDKRLVDTEQVRVRTSVDEEQVLVRDTVEREDIEITRIPVEREVAEAPPVRDEDGVTIVPVIEERLVIEKRLFLVEEIHIRRKARTEAVEMPATLRRMRVDIEREDLTNDKEKI